MDIMAKQSSLMKIPHSVQTDKKVEKQRHEQTDDDVADQRRTSTVSDAEEGTA